MKITALETIRLAEFGNLLWLRVHTDQGLTGLGETFMGPLAVEAYIHETLAPKLLGRDPRRIDAIAKDLPAISASAPRAWRCAAIPRSTSRCGTCSARSPASRSRSCSAASRARRSAPTTPAPAPPTCGATRGRAPPTGASPLSKDYDDLNGFLHRADELAARPAGRGHHGDEDLAVRPGGRSAAAASTFPTHDLKTALQPFEKIRAAVGDRMEIMVEFHSLWQLLPAMRIARALAPFDT